MLYVILYRFFPQDVVFQWLTTDNIHLNQIDAEDPEVRDPNNIFSVFKAMSVLKSSHLFPEIVITSINEL